MPSVKCLWEKWGKHLRKAGRAVGLQGDLPLSAREREGRKVSERVLTAVPFEEGLARFQGVPKPKLSVGTPHLLGTYLP